MKKKLSFFVLVLCYTCSLLFSEIPGKIIVGLNTSYPPYTFVENKHEPTGILLEIVGEAAKLIGIEVEYRRLPFARIEKDARKGEIDAVIGFFDTPDRRDYFEFLDNDLIHEENSFFTWKGSEINYSGKLEDLKNITIGVVHGYKYGGDFDLANFLKTEKCPNDKNVVIKLIKKRFDIAIGNKMVIEYYAKELHVLEKIEWLKPPGFIGYSHVISFSKAKGTQGQELARKFSEAIAQLKKNGTYRKILQKYNFKNKEYSQTNKTLFDTYEFNVPPVKLACDDWSPYYGPNMKNKGPIAEIITQAFKRVGYEVKIDFITRAKLLEKLKTGKYDAGFSAYYSIQRAKDYIFSEPIGVCSRVAFLKKKTTQIIFKKLADLKSFRIGVTRAHIYDVPEFDDAEFLNKIESTSNEANITNLIKGRIDLVIIDKVVAQYLIDKKFMDNKSKLDFLDFTDRKGELYLIISKKSEVSGQLKRDFNYGLKKIKEDGTFDRIVKKYEKYGYAYETNKK
jgi:polar amino acid transport system substrate-binding protein